MTDLLHRRSPSLAAGLSLLLLVAAACSSAATSTPSSGTPSTASESSGASASEDASESAGESGSGAATITITGSSSFGTDEITVAAGEDVTIVNNSSVSHTFTEGENGGEAEDPVVNETIPAGTQVVVQFPEAGDFHVTCLFHSSMNMEVHVQ